MRPTAVSRLYFELQEQARIANPAQHVINWRQVCEGLSTLCAEGLQMRIGDFQVRRGELFRRGFGRVVVKMREPSRLVMVGAVEYLILLKIILALFGLDPAQGVPDDAYLVIVQQPLQIGLSRLAILEQTGAHGDALSA